MELPYNISEKVMRRILIYRLRIHLLLAGLSATTFVYLCYRIYDCIVNTGAISFLQVVIADFELSYEYISDSWLGLLETMPVKEIQLLIINFVLATVLCVHIYRTYKTNKKILMNG